MSHTREDDPSCVIGYKNDPRSILLVVQPDDDVDVDVPRLAVERRLPHGLTAGGQSYLSICLFPGQEIVVDAGCECALRGAPAGHSDVVWLG